MTKRLSIALLTLAALFASTAGFTQMLGAADYAPVQKIQDLREGPIAIRGKCTPGFSNIKIIAFILVNKFAVAVDPTAVKDRASLEKFYGKNVELKGYMANVKPKAGEKKGGYWITKIDSIEAID